MSWSLSEMKCLDFSLICLNVRMFGKRCMHPKHSVHPSLKAADHSNSDTSLYSAFVCCCIICPLHLRSSFGVMLNLISAFQIAIFNIWQIAVILERGFTEIGVISSRSPRGTTCHVDGWSQRVWRSSYKFTRMQIVTSKRAVYKYCCRELVIGLGQQEEHTASARDVNKNRKMWFKVQGPQFGVNFTWINPCLTDYVWLVTCWCHQNMNASFVCCHLETSDEDWWKTCLFSYWTVKSTRICTFGRVFT